MQLTVKNKAVYIAADPSEPKEVTNYAGGTAYHKAAKDVDSGDTALVKGASVEITEGTYFVSASKSELTVTDVILTGDPDGNSKVRGSQTVAGNQTVGGKLEVDGEAELNGDINHDGTKAGFFGTAPQARPKKKAPAEISAKEIAEALETLGLLEH